eukprot:TRINITY_DN5806_c0_g1_i2.p1 TRINITY_DN5806_c0_g1~~TRINITY_DN5806_c0_g1_i2.p1  ORF type:complete len:1028 (+),score=192.27 TRINITY_DN5806_c0_g1_i2:115-3198(+)
MSEMSASEVTENICVAVRVRPLTKQEGIHGWKEAWLLNEDANTISSRPTDGAQPRAIPPAQQATAGPTRRKPAAPPAGKKKARVDAKPSPASRNAPNKRTSLGAATNSSSRVSSTRPSSIGGSTTGRTRLSIDPQAPSPGRKLQSRVDSRRASTSSSSTTARRTSLGGTSSVRPAVSASTSTRRTSLGGMSTRPTTMSTTGRVRVKKSITGAESATPGAVGVVRVKKSVIGGASGQSCLRDGAALPVSSVPATDTFGRAKFVSHTYTFDHLYGPHVDTRTIYDEVAENVVWSTMEGFNGTIFAYGQTGSGKTHTMMGRPFRRDPGVIPLAILDVFAYIKQTPEREFLLRVSYLEIYNEVINDLLAPENTNLVIHEDPQKGIFVGGVKEEIVLSPQQVMNLIALGEEYRHVGATDYNEQSSRSHTIFRLTIESRTTTAAAAGQQGSGVDSRSGGTQDTKVDLNGRRKVTNKKGAAGAAAAKKKKTEHQPVRVSVLNLIDLAGSERAGKLDTTEQRMRQSEGHYINQSLLTLSNVISKLSDASRRKAAPPKSGKAAAAALSVHIPYRDSKLTRILEPSLRGNARIAVVCTITPANATYEETHNTLKFARRAKRVTSKARRNLVLDEKTLIRKYRTQISELKRRLKSVLAAENNTSTLESMKTEKEKVEESNKIMQQQLSEAEVYRSSLEQKITRLTKLILVSSNVVDQAQSSGGFKKSIHGVDTPDDGSGMPSAAGMASRDRAANGGVPDRKVIARSAELRKSPVRNSEQCATLVGAVIPPKDVAQSAPSLRARPNVMPTSPATAPFDLDSNAVGGADPAAVSPARQSALDLLRTELGTKEAEINVLASMLKAADSENHVLVEIRKQQSDRIEQLQGLLRQNRLNCQRHVAARCNTYLNDSNDDISSEYGCDTSSTGSCDSDTENCVDDIRESMLSELQRLVVAERSETIAALEAKVLYLEQNALISSVEKQRLATQIRARNRQLRALLASSKAIQLQHRALEEESEKLKSLVYPVLNEGYASDSEVTF